MAVRRKRKGNKRGSSALRKSAPAAPPRKSPPHQRAWFPWLLLIIVTLIAYANAWPDVLVFDDREFLAGDRFDGLGPADFIRFFSQSLWEAGANASALYRPMLVVSLGLEHAVFGDWYRGYHVTAILRHIGVVLLVFGFVREFFVRTGHEAGSAQRFALLATTVFAVHPVLTDAVDSVFNGSDVYVSLAVVGGLWYLLANHRERPAKAWAVAASLYFIGLLYKESAVSMPALAVLVVWMTSDEPWGRRILRCLPAIVLVLPLALYLGMRAEALGEHDSLAANLSLVTPAYAQESPIQEVQQAVGSSPVVMEQLGLVFDPARIGTAVSMWFDALRLMVWPHPLSTLHGPSTTPLWLAVPVHLALLATALFAWFRKRPELITGLLFFYVAILPASRIVGEGALPPQMMERMLYLPSVGLVIVLAALLSWLSRRAGSRVSVLAVLILVLVFTPITWARNHQWADEIRLLEHDLAVSGNNTQLLYALVRAQAANGSLARARQLCREYEELIARHVPVSNECGKAFTQARRFEQAEAFYLRSLEISRGDARTNFHLARLYISMDRWREAKNHFESAIERERLPFLREFMSGVMLMDLYPRDPDRLRQAKQHMENTLQLQPRFSQAREALLIIEDRL
jgi:tetratricopeptide (TPR) repeat protein